MSRCIFYFNIRLSLPLVDILTNTLTHRSSFIMLNRYSSPNLMLQVLILATGFKVHEYFSPLQIIGQRGENILQLWIDKEPRSYYGIVFSSTPNLFALLGPNTVRPRKAILSGHFSFLIFTGTWSQLCCFHDRMSGEFYDKSDSGNDEPKG